MQYKKKKLQQKSKLNSSKKILRNIIQRKKKGFVLYLRANTFHSYAELKERKLNREHDY